MSQPCNTCGLYTIPCDCSVRKMRLGQQPDWMLRAAQIIKDENDSLRRELQATWDENKRLKALLDDAQACGLIHHTACTVAFGKTCDCGVGELDQQIQAALTPAPKETE